MCNKKTMFQIYIKWNAFVRHHSNFCIKNLSPSCGLDETPAVWVSVCCGWEPSCRFLCLAACLSLLGVAGRSQWQGPFIHSHSFCRSQCLKPGLYLHSDRQLCYWRHKLSFLLIFWQITFEWMHRTSFNAFLSFRSTIVTGDLCHVGICYTLSVNTMVFNQFVQL